MEENRRRNQVFVNIFFANILFFLICILFYLFFAQAVFFSFYSQVTSLFQREDHLYICADFVLAGWNCRHVVSAVLSFCTIT